jgi:hypothetical protein
MITGKWKSSRILNFVSQRCHVYQHKLSYVYVRLGVQLDGHGFICILYSSAFALHVSGAICIHPQEHKLQSTAIGMYNGYGMLIHCSDTREGVPASTCCNGLTYHNRYTYLGCTLQFVLLMMGANSTRNM